MDDRRPIPSSSACPAPEIHPRTTGFVFLGAMCGLALGLMDGMWHRCFLGDIGLSIFWQLDRWFDFVDKSGFAYTYSWHAGAFVISGLIGANLGAVAGRLLEYFVRTPGRSKPQAQYGKPSALASRWKILQLSITYPNLFSALVIALLSASYVSMMGDLDWAWQVRTGQLIVETGSLRTPESFSYTIQGAQVHDFEWLYEVTLYCVWSFLGVGGLKFLKMVCIAVPLLLLGWRLKSEGVRWHGIALSFIVAVWILAGVWNLRALYCTTVGLFLVSWWLHDHCCGKRQLTWWLPVVMLLWSNLHPGVITGQGLLCGAIGWEWINRWLKFNTPLDLARLKRLTIIGGLGVLATFVSPDPIDRLLYPFKPELAHPIQQWFIEMRPLYFFINRVPAVVIASYLLAGCVLVTVVLKLRQFRGWELALLAGLTLLANVAVRCLQDWTLIMLALAVPKMRDLLVEMARADRRRLAVRWLLKSDRFCRRLLGSNMFRFQPIWPIVTVGLFLIVTLIPPLANSLPVQQADFWPVEPVRYAEEHGLHGRFFSTPTHGAYIGWRLKENGLIYTDTRGFFFPPNLLEDSILIPAKGPDWQARLDRVLNEYHTDYFVLDVKGECGTLWRDLQPHIDKPLSQDDRFVLLSADQVRQGLEKAARSQMARR